MISNIQHALPHCIGFPMVWLLLSNLSLTVIEDNLYIWVEKTLVSHGIRVVLDVSYICTGESPGVGNCLILRLQIWSLKHNSPQSFNWGSTGWRFADKLQMLWALEMYFWQCPSEWKFSKNTSARKAIAGFFCLKLDHPDTSDRSLEQIGKIDDWKGEFRNSTVFVKTSNAVENLLVYYINL